MINVIIAEDQKLLLQGFISLLKSRDDINIVGGVSNGKEVLSIVANEMIDIAVLDIEMPEMDGIETAKILRENYPNIKILMLTMYNEIGFIRKVMEVGAQGYILKNRGIDELLLAIDSIYGGGEYFGKDVDKTLRDSLRNNEVVKVTKLTKREIEVLKLIGEGFTTKKISEALFIADSTVETHRRNLLEKTGAINSKALVKYAVKKGYV